MSTRKAEKNAAPRAASLSGTMSDDVLQKLIAENRRLGEELQEVQKLAAALEKTNAQSIAARDKAAKELEGVRKTATELKTQVDELTASNRKLTAESSRLTRQVERTPLNPLSPEEAAALFDKFIGGMKLSRNLELRDVNLTLKVATGKLGNQAVLLLPEPGAVDPATLHELKLNLRGTSVTEVLATDTTPRRG
jgi:seryl-tRNA synthetase